VSRGADLASPVPLHEEKQIFLSLKVIQTLSDSGKCLNPHDNLQRSDCGWAAVFVGTPAGGESTVQACSAITDFAQDCQLHSAMFWPYKAVLSLPLSPAMRALTVMTGCNVRDRN